MPETHRTADGLTVAAQFNPLYRPYLLISIGLAMAVSIVGLPLAVVWFCGVGQWWSRHYFDLLQCELGPTTLKFRKGILFQVEKTIPHENIQDVTFIEGPLLRRFHLSTLKFETAGHSVGQAHDMHLTGIIDAHEFRNRIVAAREALRAQRPHASVGAGGVGATSSEVLERIAAKLDEIACMLRERQA